MSTEVLHEVLHRYHRMGRPDIADEVYALTVQACTEVFPVTLADTYLCLKLPARTGPEESVRDALHVAVMRTIDDDAAASFDTRPARFGITK